MRGGGKGAKIKGTLLLAEGGKIRFDGRASFDGKDERMIVISDGKLLRSIQKDREPKDIEVAKNFHPALMTALKRAGAVTGFMVTREGRGLKDDIKVEDLFKMSAFKLGKKEKLGERMAQSLEYQVTFPADGKELTGTVTLWLDAKTQLPLKHVLKAQVPGEGDIVISQTYTSFRLDEKIDAKLFELPK